MEGNAPLLQLPHVDADILRKLFRKKLRTLPEMQAADPKERREALLSAGLTGEQVHAARQHAPTRRGTQSPHLLMSVQVYRYGCNGRSDSMSFRFESD